jgi:hypothetical protein
MAERDTDEYFHGTDDPMARLNEERRRLDELGRVWTEETTTVRAKDNTFSMTFDGRGELTEVTFHGSKYRTISATELGHRIVETLKQGKQASLEKMIATMNPESYQGLDLMGIATGKVDPRKALDAVIAPLLDSAPYGDPKDIRRV